MNRYRVVALRAGTFRGEKPPKPIRFSRAVLAASFKSLEGKPFRFGHGGPIVGRMERVRFESDAVVADVVLNASASHYAVAKAFFDSILMLGGTPNVSIEGDFIASDADVLDVVSFEFTALAAVPRGACSDLAGCGVVAALSQGVKMDTNTELKEAPAAEVPAATTSGSVTFTVVNDAPAKPADCGCKEAEAKLASASTALEAKLAAANAAVESLKAELAAERARVPLLVELAAVLPDFKTDGMGAAELKAALGAAKLAPASVAGARKSLLAEPAAPKPTARDALSAMVAKEMRR